MELFLDIHNMSYTFSNTVYTNGADVLFQFKENMKAAGWTVIASGTGTGGSYNSSGDSIGSNLIMSQARAWFVLRCPTTINGVNRQISIQNSATVSGVNALNARIKYSYTGTFGGGSPAAGVVSSAPDEQIVAGGGTDAAPTFNAWGGTALTLGAVNKFITVIGDSAEGNCFISYCISKSAVNTLQSQHAFMMDKMDDIGSTDIDPYVLFLANNGGWTFFSANQVTNGPFCWWKKGGVEQKWARVYGLFNKFYNLSGTIDGNSGLDPWTGRDKLLPVFYGSDANSYPDCGLKGRSHLLMVSMNGIVDDGYTATYNGGTRLVALNTAGTQYSFPWIGSTTSIV